MNREDILTYSTQDTICSICGERRGEHESYLFKCPEKIDGIIVSQRFYNDQFFDFRKKKTRYEMINGNT